jgi:short subunit dehydrogenase-like uncharacterized protein
MSSWILYGANGYTGELIARAARERGLEPVLAGRNREAVERLARELGFASRCFSLDDADATRAALRGMRVVLHCAGPFSATAAPMLRACLAERVHYLDITGEVEVFEHAQRFDAEAARGGVLLCPGVGFDVVPTDCLSALLKEKLPDATHLALGFDSRSPLSRGTSKTMVEGLATGSRARIDGALVVEPLARRVREIDFGDGLKTAMAIAWGDVSTAWWTTRIPNIEVYIPASPRAVKSMRRMNRLRLLLRLGFVQRWLKARVDRKPPGPDARQREGAAVHLWGEARNASGRIVTARMRTANAYTVTVEASLRIVSLLLGQTPRSGYATPSQLMGAGFVTQLPGSSGPEWG